MTNLPSKQLRRVFGILLSVMLVVAGICLMITCCSIYYTGSRTFSREIVAANFAKIAIPVYLCLAMVILGFILELFLPVEKQKTAAEKNYGLILEKLHAKTDLMQCDEAVQIAVSKEHKSRKCHKIVSILLLAAGSVIFLCYALNGNNFHQREITDSLIQAMYLLIPCMAVPFGYAVFSAYFSRGSIQREIDLLRQAGANRSPAPAAEPKKCKAAPVLRWVFLAAAVAILVFGYITGGTADVLTKAINICTECVGLG